MMMTNIPLSKTPAVIRVISIIISSSSIMIIIIIIAQIDTCYQSWAWSSLSF